MVALGQGVRLAWSDLPPSVRSAVAELAGGPGAVVASTEQCAGGFSPSAAVRVTLADGRRAFAKAVSVAQNPTSPRIYRREAAANAWLPRHPAIPALHGTYDDGTWVALVFDDVPAVPPRLPWSRADLDLVLAALGSVQAAAGRLDGVAVPVGEQYADDFASWRAIAASPPEGLDPWSAAHAERCAEVEGSWAAYAEGATLLHTDLRADNLLVAGGRAWLVDWPWACAGAAWVDAVLMAPSVALQGGPPPEELVAAAYPSAPRDGVTAVAAALAGFFTTAALQPAPPGLPTVREHQAACGRETRAWLARLLDG
jgi:aminoglycoside phosphotransferase (APT) family kinase protein